MNSIRYYSGLLRDGILKNYKKMFRAPEGFLKRPYLDPAGQYGKNLWDWDSYFATTGLFRMLKDKHIGKKIKNSRNEIVEHTTGALLNFFDHQAEDGTIPISMLPTDPDIFKCRDRNKGEETNMAKPVFGQFLMAIIRNTGNIQIAKEIFDKLLLFYECYRRNYLDKDTGLFVWGSDVAIGVDDDPTTWSRPNFSSANLLLNCLMCVDLLNSSKIAAMLDRASDCENLKIQAKNLKSAILKYCWDKRDGFFYTVDIQCKKHIYLGLVHKNLDPFWKVIPLKIMTWVGFLPLWAKICTPEQAKIMVKQHLFNEERFLSKFGIRSLSKDEIMYQPEVARGNPSNWLGPIWIIANYLIWEGLKNYSFNKEADELAKRIILLLGRDIEENGYLHEYYSPETGKGVMGKDFWNWNILVLFMI